MKKGTILRDKFSGRFFTATGEISTMTNGKRTWECIEFDNGARVSVEEVENGFKLVGETENGEKIEAFLTFEEYFEGKNFIIG